MICKYCQDACLDWEDIFSLRGGHIYINWSSWSWISVVKTMVWILGKLSK